MSKFQSTLIDDDHIQVLGGKQIRPPLIPSNTDKIYTKSGIYNLKGFYEDLSIRLDRQKQTVQRINQNCTKNLNLTNVSYVGSIGK